MYVCMIVCVYVCMVVCVYVCMVVCVYVCMIVWVYVIMYEGTSGGFQAFIHLFDWQVHNLLLDTWGQIRL